MFIGALGTTPVIGSVQVSGINSTVPVTGTVLVSNTVPVTGTVLVTNTIPVTGTVLVTSTIPVIGSVAVSSVSSTVPVSGTVFVSHNTNAIGHGVKTVTSAGTDETVVGTVTLAKWVTIQAQTDNTGIVAVGAAGVDATVATGNGVALAAGESFTFPCDDLNDISIDATVSGEGVRYTYGA